MKREVYRFSNNAASMIAEELFPDTTEIVLAPGSGDRFPELEEGYTFTGTLSKGSLNEIVNVIRREGDVLRVERGQEGTIAQAWPEGTLFGNLLTKVPVNEFVQAYPDREELFGSEGRLSLGTSNPPLTLSSPGSKGEITYDDDRVYVCFEDGKWNSALLSRGKQSSVNLWDFDFNIEDPVGFSLACNAAARLQDVQVNIPGGTFYQKVPPQFEVAPNQGAAVWLDENCNNVSFVGAAGQTRIVPVSNTMEMFVQVGANDLCFEDIVFDNEQNGPLNGYAWNASSFIPGGGTAVLNNAANCAVRQYFGAGLTVKGCELRSFRAGFQYLGNYLNNNELVGYFKVSDIMMDGCVTAVFARKAKSIVFNDWVCRNAVATYNASGAGLVGHAFYLTDQSGASPENVTISGGQAYNCVGSPLQLRNGVAVTIDNLNFVQCQRAVNFENLQHLTMADFEFVLGNIWEPDTDPTALRCVGLGYYNIGRGSIDTQGTRGRAIRLHADNSNPPKPWTKKYGYLSDITIYNDNQFNANKSEVYVVEEQVDVILKDITCFRTGDYQTSDPMVYVDGGTRVSVVDPRLRTALAGNPLGSDRLVTFTSTCVDCYAQIPADALDVPVSNVTVLDSGTRTRVNFANRGGPSVRTVDFTVPNHLNVFVNAKNDSDLKVVLPPAGTNNNGDVLRFINRRAFTVISSNADGTPAANVIPLEGGSPVSTILSGTVGSWVDLQSNGTFWVEIANG